MNVEVDTLTLPPEEQHKIIRQELLININSIINREYSTLHQYELCEVLDLAQSRVSHLRRRNASKFSIEKLVEILNKLGKKVNIEVV